jgi:hypothetical protein
MYFLYLPTCFKSILSSLLRFLVSLQPFEYDPNEKNKHKFMVQSMFAPDGDINQDTLVSMITNRVPWVT